MIAQYRFVYFIRPLLLALLGGAVIGFWVGYPVWGLFAGALAYALYPTWQLYRLYRWLVRDDLGQLPNLKPPYSYISHFIYQQQRKHRREQQRLHGFLKRVRESTQALADGLIIADQQGRLQWWNQAAARYIGLRDMEDRGHALTNLVRTPEFIAFFNQASLHQSLVMLSPINQQTVLQLSLTTYGDAEKLILIQDVTRLKQLEQMRQDFVANASHELRTPLTVLTGYLESFLDQPNVMPTAWQRPFEQMMAQVLRMNNLVKDLLLLARLDNQRSSVLSKRVDVVSLLEGIVHDARILSGDKQQCIQLVTHSNSQLMGDAQLLRSAFSNLVYNAVHYTPAGGKIDILWYTDDQGLYCSVKDNGSGIDAVHIPRLTERFYRVDSSRSSHPGSTGLGLSIVKHILQGCGATLDIQSQLGAGSQFTCCFPIKCAVREVLTDTAAPVESLPEGQL